MLRYSGVSEIPMSPGIDGSQLTNDGEFNIFHHADQGMEVYNLNRSDCILSPH